MLYDQDETKLHNQLVEHYGKPTDEQRDAIVKHMWRSKATNTPLIVSGGLIGGPNHGPLKKAMGEFSKGTPTAFKTYSGVNNSFGGKLGKIKVGDTVRFPAWTSSSIGPTSAQTFAEKAKITGTKRIVVFHIPEGFKHGAYIDHVDPSWGENEFLIHAGTKWRKTGVTKEKLESLYTKHKPEVLKQYETIHYHHMEPAT